MTATRLTPALLAHFVNLNLGRVAEGGGLPPSKSPAGELLALHHEMGEGVAVRTAVANCVSLIQATRQLDLDAFDPWLENLSAAEVELYRARDLSRPVHGDMDLLAWYRPFHHMTFFEYIQLPPAAASWGIYLSTAGVETLAREAFLPQGVLPDAALQAAARALYGHELFHFLAELAVTATETRAVQVALATSTPAQREGLPLPPSAQVRLYQSHRAAHGGSYCETEEALANLHSLRLTEEAERSGLMKWMRNGPPGYNDSGNVAEAGPRREALRSLLGHCSGVTAADVPVLDELAFDLEHVHSGLDDVPLFLVVSPGSAYEAGAWEWQLARPVHP